MKKSITVLAVENEAAYGLLLRHAMDPLGVSWRFLSTASETQEYLSHCSVRWAPDAAVLDLRHLQDTGLGLLRWIRSDRRFHALPVVVLSGRDDASDVNRAYELGIEAYVAMPAKVRELAMTLSGVLATCTGTGMPISVERVRPGGYDARS